MFVGIGRVELLVGDSQSLKAKRQVLKHLIQGAQSKFRLAVAEVGYQDQWQRSTIGFACVSETSFQVRKVLREVFRWIETDDRIEVLSTDEQVVSPDD